MAKIKFDAKQLKQMAAERYEMLALIGIGAFAVIFLLWGVVAFFSESSPEAEIKDAARKMEAERTSGAVPPPLGASKERRTAWPAVDLDKVRTTFDQPLFVSGAAGENRRFSPKILPLDTDANRLAVAQIDVLSQGVFTYDGDGNNVAVFKSADPKTPSYDAVFVIAHKHLVVVSATFPYLEQAELYRKALRLDRLDELFAKGLAPTFEGFNVQRRVLTTVNGKDKPGDWMDVYMYDPVARKQTVGKGVAELMQSCYLDGSQVDKYYDVIYGASVTPQPALAGAKQEYPEIKLAALANRPAPSLPEGGKMPKEGAMPPPPGGGQPGVPGAKPPPYGRARTQLRAAQGGGERGTDFLSPKDMPQDLKDQLNAATDGKFNWFTPYGTFADEEQVKARAEREKLEKDAKDAKSGKVQPGDFGKGKPPQQFPPPGGSGFPNQQGVEDLNYKAPDTIPSSPKGLIRFVDAGVVPGQKYQYRIQIRLANPNYGLPAKMLSQPGLARIKELVSDWVETAPVSVPVDYVYYLTSQDRKFHHDPARLPKGAKTVDVAKETFSDKVLAERLPFEIFKFVDSFDEGSTKRYVADWVCAERLLVGRGEVLGRDKVETDTVIWNKTKGVFEQGGTSTAKGGPKGGKGTGLIPIDFRPEQRILLLDFIGGKHVYKQGSAPEESAAEALLLMPDGTMIVRNSRNDMTEVEEISPLGPERLRRWTEWKRRLDDVRTGGSGGGKTDKGSSNN